MINVTGSRRYLAPDVRFALGSIISNSTYGEVPILDQHDTVGPYRGEGDSVLEFVPAALAAYVDYEQHQCS